VVLNSLSGDLIEKSFGLLRAYGRFVEIGKRDYYADRELGLRPFLRNLSFSLVDLRGMMVERPAWVRALFAELLDHVRAGALSPPKITARPIGDIAEVFHTMASGHHMGKLVLTFDREPMLRTAAAGEVAVRGDASYLITGGLGGLGLSVAGWLAERGAGRVVLVGRSGASTPAQHAAIEAIRARGTQVTVARADVARRDDVERVVAEAGPSLRGVIHAAGVLDDGLVLQQTPAKLRAVMAPKLLGALHLHALTRSLPLDLFVLYGSGAGLLGSPGQANYAAANVFLDALAHHRRARGLPALAIDWGAFSEVGLAAAQDNRAARLEARGMRSLTPDDGLRALARLIASGRTQTGVIPLDVRQWIEFYPAAAASRMLAPLIAAQRAGAAITVGGEGVRAQLAAASADEQVAIVEAILGAQVGRVLRLDDDELDRGAPLTSLGMDSLTGLELRNRIESALGVAMPATLLWAYPTIAALARHLISLLVGGEPAASPVIPAPATASSEAVADLNPDDLLSFIDGLIDRANHSEPPQ
jgi:NAD(P)-dependent dehydrogenase (short-subunit alcohol dehydrogenase family)/acyl carrier protein